MKKKRIHIFICLAMALAITGCERDNFTRTPASGDTPLLFRAAIGHGKSAYVDTKTTRASQSDPAELAAINKEMDEARKELEKTKFDYSERPDVIRICNVSTSTEAPDFSLNSGKTYAYRCEKHYDNKIEDGKFPDNGSTEEDDYVKGHYTEYSEYSFVPSKERDDSKEDQGFYLSNLVNNGNAFSFFGLYKHDYPQDGSMTVSEHQDILANFRNSDILMAWLSHNIDKFEEPFRFVFYHSLSMLDIRVSVPLYEAGTTGAEEKLPSGYRRDEVNMSMTNVPVGFIVASTENISSGDPVSVVRDPGKGNADDIPMYKYYVEDPDKTYVDTDAGHLENDTEDGSQSRYRTYGFCGIAVPGTWDEGKPLLRLKLKDPVTGDDEYYTYTPNRGTAEEAFSLTGGQISVLHFKISRSLKEMVLVQARVMPWNEATGTLDLMEEPVDN